MFEDYEYSNEMTFAALEKAEAEKFTSSLLEIDKRLYTSIGSDSQVDKTVSDGDCFPKYYSEGYDANYEGVEDVELIQWQRGAFQYLRCEGKAMMLPTVTKKDNMCTKPTHTQDISVDNDQHYIDELGCLPRADDGIQNLAVIGKAMSIPKILIPNERNSTIEAAKDENDEEEIIAQHGILQEYVDYSGVCVAAADDGSSESDTLNPPESNREEIVSSMMDAVWPDVVKAMKPFIYKVLVTAKENNIPYEVDQRAVAKSEYADDGDDFGGDGFW